LVEICDLSGNNNGFKALYIIQKTIEESSKMGLVFHKLHITENTVSVPNNFHTFKKHLKDTS